jgi:LCP family protein required for cell wall assembly
VRKRYLQDEERVPNVGAALVKRGLLAMVLVVMTSATALATTVVLEVDDIKNAFIGEGRVAVDIPEITKADAGGARTILLLGSDARYEDKKLGLKPRSDTILLVRLDPDKEVIAMTSIPRDLLVTVPGVGDAVKINSAYENGGERLAVKTVKELLSVGGRDFKINHVVTVDFGGFQRAIDYIGCVYTDIDRDYFNDNTGPGGYAAIDIDPGYQKLCGKDALSYVRYRHNDNDLVRAARQQDFLRQVRTAKGTKKLISGGIAPGNLKKLARVFGRYFDRDKSLDSTKEIFKFAKTVLFTAGNPVREVQFRVTSAPDNINLVANEEMLEETVSEFLDAKASAVPRQNEEPSDEDVARSAERERQSTKVPSGVRGLEENRTAGENAAILGSRKIDFPFFFPTLQTTAATFQSEEPYTYKLKDERGKKHDAYRIVAKKSLGVGEYYGIQGMTWRYPPILDDPHEDVRVGKRKMMVYRDGKRIRLIAWRTPKAVYWVSNTLTRSLSNQQMLGIAGSLRKLG